MWQWVASGNIQQISCILQTEQHSPFRVKDILFCLGNVLLAICIHRGVPAGIYETNNPEECHFVANGCKANVIVVENQEQLDKILKVSIVIIEVYILSFMHTHTKHTEELNKEST